ncbi:MAG TPA: cyclopropane-fatty-acyl-phospholipid synthase family protein [Bauldia sp.]
MFLLSQMLRSIVRVGTLTLIDADGRRHVFAGAPGPAVTARLTDKSLPRRMMMNPSLAVGEAYMDGTLVFEGGSTLSDGLALFAGNSGSLSTYPLQRVLRGVKRNFRRFQQMNPIGRARENVAHHYDIGNDFYRLFLDDGMQYSCAYFLKETDTLEQAQENKLRLIAAKLQLKPGQRILDIGSGWGTMAMYLAKVADVDVTGVTLSEEQHVLSNKRAAEAGLSSRVRFELRDYREQPGPFDRIVSVGMFEHVGVPHYGEFFARVRQLLTEDGITLLHSIGHMRPPGGASPWIRKYIFPGAYGPALSEVFAATERAGLWVTDVEILRLHYARTLHEWGRRFAANRDKVAAMYDERFCRMWEFYLATCEMIFERGPQQVFQMQLTRRIDAAPVVRDYMVDTQRRYREAG